MASSVALQRSTLARLQAGMTLGSVAVVVWASVWLWPISPMWAVVLAATVLGGYAGVLGVEFALAAHWNRRSDVAPCAAHTWLSAWWAEVLLAPRVFAWRQPFFWRSLPDDAAHATVHGPPCVVLVHGFVCNRGFWLPWMQALRARGLPYVTVNLEPVFGSIDAYVPLVEAAVARAQALSGRPVVLLCHSMGGLAARAWAAGQSDLASRVARIITLGSPHQGTWLARFSRTHNGQQMRLDSEWLRELQVREASARPLQPYGAFTCWYSNTDNIVMPADTARLPGADNRLLPGWPHVGLAFAPTVVADTLALLEAKVDSALVPD